MTEAERRGKWRDRPCKRDGKKEIVSDIDLVILIVLSGDSNLPPTHDEETWGKGKREKDYTEGGSGGWHAERGGAVPSSGAEKCCNLLFH